MVKLWDWASVWTSGVDAQSAYPVWWCLVQSTRVTPVCGTGQCGRPVEVAARGWTAVVYVRAAPAPLLPAPSSKA